MYKHILLPTDGSPLSERAVTEGIQLAKALGARVSALHITPLIHPESENPTAFAAQVREHERRSEATARTALGQAEQAARAAGVAYTALHKEGDSPWEEIISAAAAAGCDLIFMASHGRRGVSALVLGSETNKVLTHSKVPVLVVR
ncbi:MAG: universal stress protein [Bacteroidota bacterium]|jgi:nucleotide-binding universal stress UspA family protein